VCDIRRLKSWAIAAVYSKWRYLCLLTAAAAAAAADNAARTTPLSKSAEVVVEKTACGSDNADDDDGDEMEQEEMYVTPHESFEFQNVSEWGGPRRGGRLLEPTRFGDWERKGRCSDF
jgi:hypothetical protein